MSTYSKFLYVLSVMFTACCRNHVFFSTNNTVDVLHGLLDSKAFCISKVLKGLNFKMNILLV